MDLQGPGVAGLPEAFDGPGVPEEVRVHPFGDPGPLGGCLNNLPGPPAVDLKDAVVQLQLAIEGEALEAMGQGLGAGHQARFPALTQDKEDGAPLLGAYVAGGQA